MPKYFDGVIYYCPMMPDIALIDWQLRLLSHLSKLGYEILVKPHPESQIDVPEFFKDSIGVKVLTEKFEKAYKKADILLIDYPGSTTFGFALKTKKPVDIARLNLPKQLIINKLSGFKTFSTTSLKAFVIPFLLIINIFSHINLIQSTSTPHH